MLRMDVIPNGGKPGLLGGVPQEEEKYGGHGEQDQAGDDECVMPANFVTEVSRKNPGEDIPDGVAGGEAADQSAPAGGGVPVGERVNHQGPPCGLSPAIDGPEQAHAIERGGKGEEEVRGGGDQECDGHHPPRAIALAQGAVHDLAQGINRSIGGGDGSNIGAGPAGEGKEDLRLGHRKVHPAQVVGGIGTPQQPENLQLARAKAWVGIFNISHAACAYFGWRGWMVKPQKLRVRCFVGRNENLAN